jgi:hypothetical protein
MNDNINMDSTIEGSVNDNINMDSTIEGLMNDNINMDSTIVVSMNDNINMDSTIEVSISLISVHGTVHFDSYMWYGLLVTKGQKSVGFSIKKTACYNIIELLLKLLQINKNIYKNIFCFYTNNLKYRSKDNIICIKR